jgi:hypothetical protein
VVSCGVGTSWDNGALTLVQALEADCAVVMLGTDYALHWILAVVLIVIELLTAEVAEWFFVGHLGLEFSVLSLEVHRSLAFEGQCDCLGLDCVHAFFCVSFVHLTVPSGDWEHGLSPLEHTGEEELSLSMWYVAPSSSESSLAP